MRGQRRAESRCAKTRSPSFERAAICCKSIVSLKRPLSCFVVTRRGPAVTLMSWDPWSSHCLTLQAMRSLDRQRVRARLGRRFQGSGGGCRGWSNTASCSFNRFPLRAPVALGKAGAVQEGESLSRVQALLVASASTWVVPGKGQCPANILNRTGTHGPICNAVVGQTGSSLRRNGLTSLAGTLANTHDSGSSGPVG